MNEEEIGSKPHPFFLKCCKKRPPKFLYSGTLLHMTTSIIFIIVDLGLIISLVLANFRNIFLYFLILDLSIFRFPKLIYSSVIIR